MMAGGDDGTDKGARVLARRPTIRPRAVTPPRTAAVTSRAAAPVTKAQTWTLPPVRLPSPRVRATESATAHAATRPVLLLVADASDQFEVARRHDDEGIGAARRAWRAPRTMALAALTMLVLAAAGVVVVWASARPTEQLQTSALAVRATSTATSAAVSMPPSVPKATQPAAPSIPVFDVKSLPPAPRR